jgi:hypothetical protein
MLNDRVREILFWFTVGMIIVVAAVAVVTILQARGGSVALESPPEISPGEVSLCTGERHQFTVESEGEGEGEVTWEATGGTIGESGLFTAGDTPGDYIVTAARSESRRIAQAIVHVAACTPTPTPVPSPTPTPTPTATPTLEPTPTPPADLQGDVGSYESGAPVEGAPAGVDIRAASVAPDLRVDLQPTEGVPAELAGWASEGEALLWIALHEPIPAPPAVFIDWLFALDLDGDITTGRPAGTGRVNPDLGTEATIGVSYSPASGEYEPYFWVWDPAQEDWTEVADEVRLYLSESRTLIGLALPLETLTQNVAQTTGVTVVPEAVKGRAGALSYAGAQGVIDFYPDRPE